MIELLDQIDLASDSSVYYLALQGALTVPDIAGALGRPSGEASGQSYRRWAQENLSRWSDEEDAWTLWNFRCAVLHQNRGAIPERFGGHRLVFAEPAPGQPLYFHGMTLYPPGNTEAWVFIDLPSFCREITDAARAWLARNQDNPIVSANLEASIKRHPDGWQGWQGIPVIT